jgi:uncharacterized membrane protein
MMEPIGPHTGLFFLGGLATLLFWAGVVVLIVWAVRSMTARPWFGGTPPPAGPAGLTAPTPRQLLDERLVKGEISVEEYEKIKAALGG